MKKLSIVLAMLLLLWACSEGSISGTATATNDGNSNDGGSDNGGSDNGESDDGGSDDGGSDDGGSDDGGSDDGGSDEEQKTIAGSVIDGPLHNARVFLDIDDDGEWDSSEPYTFTDENGTYQLEAPEDYFDQYRLVAEITAETIDTETGEVAHPYSLVFYDPNTQSAFEGFLSTDFVLNPFTTMVQSEVEAGNAPLDAVELVATHLGLNPEHHFYLLADYMEVKDTGVYLG